MKKNYKSSIEQLLSRKQGQRDLVRSKTFISEDDALRYLAEVLVESFLEQKHEQRTTEKNSNLL